MTAPGSRNSLSHNATEGGFRHDGWSAFALFIAALIAL